MRPKQRSTISTNNISQISRLLGSGGYNTAVVDNAEMKQKDCTFGLYDKTAPTFKWIVDNNTQAQSKEVRLETSERNSAASRMKDGRKGEREMAYLFT